MVTYIDANSAPMKNTGQIRLYGPEGFEGMRKASQITARCLDELVEPSVPGITTNEIDRFRVTNSAGSRRPAGNAELPRLHQILLHLDQPRGLSRHSQ
jgi:hypothetical protein